MLPDVFGPPRGRRMISLNGAAQTWSNSTAVQTVLSVPIVGAQVGDTYRAVVAGSYLNNSGANASARIYYFLNGSQMFDDASVSIVSNVERRAIRIEAEINFIGQSDQRLYGSFSLGANSGNNAGSVGLPIGNFGVGDVRSSFVNMQLAIAWASSMTFEVRMNHQQANANIEADIRLAYLERL